MGDPVREEIPVSSRFRALPPEVAAARDAVRSFWGSHLYVRMSDWATAMDWREILLPESSAEWGEDRLTACLLHEWGHRMISPQSPERFVIWQKAAQKEGLGKAQSHLVANLAADFWVDGTYLTMPRWSRTFRAGLKEGLGEMKARLRPLAEDSENAGWVNTFQLTVDLYERMLGEQLPGERLPSSEADANAQDATWRYLNRHEWPHALRVRGIARSLHGLLPTEAEVALVLGALIREFDGRRLHPSWSDCREAKRAGLDRADFDSVFGEGAWERLHTQRRRLQMYARVVPLARRVLARSSRREFSGYAPWRPGMRMRDLDIRATFDRSPVLLPGVNTLRGRFEMKGLREGTGAGAVVLVVDDSGSTEGEILEREIEATFAVLAAARLCNDPVGLVVFGGDVTLSLPMTTRYEEIEEALCRLRSASGGTVMAPALREAFRLAGGLDRFAVLMMTDSWIADHGDVAVAAHAKPGGAELTAFCFAMPDAVREEFGKLVAGKMRIFAASPETPFMERALEEIYG